MEPNKPWKKPQQAVPVPQGHLILLALAVALALREAPLPQQGDNVINLGEASPSEPRSQAEKDCCSTLSAELDAKQQGCICDALSEFPAGMDALEKVCKDSATELKSRRCASQLALSNGDACDRFFAHIAGDCLHLLLLSFLTTELDKRRKWLLPPLWPFSLLPTSFAAQPQTPSPPPRRCLARRSLCPRATSSLLASTHQHKVVITLPTASTYYIAIWFSNIPVVTTVWTANTDTPVSDPAMASFSISTDGNLVVFDQSKNRQIWSTNASIDGNSTIATILDSGSLELTDAFDSSRVYWRSIDHPTNTWLPGGKLGLNKATGVSQRLTSWRSSVDPFGGLLSLLLDPNGTTEYLIQWNNSMMYWTSGPWDGRGFSRVPEMRLTNSSTFQFIDNANESYFTYQFPYYWGLSRAIMDIDGQFKHLMWFNESQKWSVYWSQPQKHCEVYAICGLFGSCKLDGLVFCSCIKGFSVKVQSDWDHGVYSGGCKRDVPLNCPSDSSSAKGHADKFHAVAVVRLPDKAQSAVARSPEDCRLTCLNNCSCSAYTYNSNGCFVWHGDLVNLHEQYSGDGETLFVRLAASELPDAGRRKTVSIGAVASGVVAVLIILVTVLFIIQRCYKASALKMSVTIAGNRLTTFRYSDLQHATENFSMKLGGGAFGSVFKGQLPGSSTPIAVKRLDGLLQGDKQFRAEVVTVGEGSCTILDWKTRYSIASGIARALAYLHDQCRECIIHCDLKPENILLDANFQAKVADFGLAKLVGRDFSCVLTTMRGTMGYLAPEWFSGLPITSKIDVYSFGMMLFELISGRRNALLSESDTSSFFPCWAAIQVIDGNERNILDHRLGGVADMEELLRASRLACWCIQYEAYRPSMALVVKMMEGLLDVDVPPFPGPLCCLFDNQASSLTDINRSDHDPSEK
ncbi:G-type lectin S-receptor-like serine/threonine-protein kinase [Dichanthelium oligosanthes]|uniref:non-specific serine/threonine protein kinase n=1 Tax=Dichanthelium oligosanthes TaxID=888268 RepID=A0A1E5WIF4_9POAL|nr:G-type lectin S-receptor-like serine/threonine-protein kinase [Dichanthelium oligosanthes]